MQKLGCKSLRRNNKHIFRLPWKVRIQGCTPCRGCIRHDRPGIRPLGIPRGLQWIGTQEPGGKNTSGASMTWHLNSLGRECEHHLPNNPSTQHQRLSKAELLCFFKGFHAMHPEFPIKSRRRTQNWISKFLSDIVSNGCLPPDFKKS